MPHRGQQTSKAIEAVGVRSALVSADYLLEVGPWKTSASLMQVCFYCACFLRGIGRLSAACSPSHRRRACERGRYA